MARVPKYRLHKATGNAIVTINCQDIYLGKHGTKESKRRYKTLIIEWQAGGSTISFVHTSASMVMVMRDYLAHCETHYPDGPNSKTGKTRYALSFARMYDTLPIHEFGPLKLKAVCQAMLEAASASTGKPFSRGYSSQQLPF